MTIPASHIVNIIPGVLAAGGNSLDLNAVILTNNESIPLGTVRAFPDADSVAAWFGAESREAALAAVYFKGYNNALALPGTLFFAQFNDNPVGAYLRSGSFEGVALSTLQALSGTLSLLVDGALVTSANINLATATSFTNAAALIQTGLTADGSGFSGNGHIDNGTGSGTGNTLTVTAVNSGQLHIGTVVKATEFDVGTTITAFLTGTGGLGTYTVSGIPQNTGPAAFTAQANLTVEYDAQHSAFIVRSPTTGVGSTIGFAFGSLSVGVKLTQATSAVTSQGAGAGVAAATMDAVKQAQSNWASFLVMLDLDTTGLLPFAAWVNGQNNRYVMVAYDLDDTAATTNDAPDCFARQCEAAEYEGVIPVFEIDAGDGYTGKKAAFVCGMIASIAFDQPNGRIDFAFKTQSGLTPDVTNGVAEQNLLANGYNFFGNYGTANDDFTYFYKGTTPGPWKFADTYVNQIWLNSELQLALMVLLTQVNSLPYNAEGYNLVRQAITDPARRAVLAGVIRPGVTLSASQRAQINASAGVGVPDAIQNNGWYAQILDAAPEVRATRGSPPVKFWYTDGGSIQQIVLPSIAIQ